ncbi:MAG: hypothetical protein EOP61_10830 [Sphingomonadales bacterium]|nr:MAG: hypothetical protein EOP61_10830 [Sphingomonadales bacterium]
MKVNNTTRFPTHPQTRETTGWRIVVGPIDVQISEDADLEQAHEILAQLMQPAPHSQLLAWLAELAAVTAARQMSPEDGEVAVYAYARRLAGYPHDIVEKVVLDWTGKWFPTWAELREVLDDQLTRRRVVVAKVMAEITLARVKALEAKCGAAQRDGSECAALSPVTEEEAGTRAT